MTLEDRPDYTKSKWLAKQFSRARIDHAWTVRIDAGWHKLLHEDAILGGVWNQRWREFFEKNPRARKAQILDFAAELMDEFGLPSGVDCPAENQSARGLAG